MTSLTKGQITVLTLATLPMIAVGIGGAIGTYANAASVLHRQETALGVVAAGEGATLVAALVMLGLTMLGQAAPLAIRAALWLLPTAASIVGIVIAPSTREAVVFAVTPMAMTVSAEGLALLARRIVVKVTGQDIEAQRRNATTLQRLAYHRARAAKHPSERVRSRSERISWRLARRVGAGDAQLGMQLVEVQRSRMSAGADAALTGMLTAPAADAFDVVADEAVAVAAPQPDVPALPPAQPPTQPDAEPDAAASTAGQTPDAVRELRTPDADAQLLAAALRINAAALADTGRPASLRTLQAELRIGQRRAQRIQQHLPKGA